MLSTLKKMLTENIALKITALVIALALWFYIVNELNKGSETDREFMTKMLPSEGVVAKKLMIKPIFFGTPRNGYEIDRSKVVIVPDYCIVVGSKEMLSEIRYVYTAPVDVRGIWQSRTASVPLNPIAPGIFMEETSVQVAIPIGKARR